MKFGDADIDALMFGDDTVSAVYFGDDLIWPSVVADISQFYGVGPGQIPGDWRADEPTVSGGLVTHIRNDGGAGALFDLSNSTGDGPAWTNGFVVPGGASQTPMTFAQGPDLIGIHLLVVVDPAGVTSNGDVFSGDLKGNPRIAVNNSQILLGPAGRPAYIQGAYSPLSGLNLVEARWDTAGVTLIANSTVLASITPPGVSTYKIPSFGRSRDGASNVFSGRVGRWLSVICDSGYSAANPEPAVIAVRELLTQQYGISG